MFEELLKIITAYRASGCPCLVHALTGYYCPGCGGTRAVIYLLHGHFLLSFLYHPLVIYTVACALYVLLRHLYDFIKKGCFKKASYLSISMLWVALGITLINFAVKNICLFCGIDLLN